ncbi:MAG: hypothetical protein A3K14_03815 [Sulfurimonas sp. RIFCSPLOWO2_12_FULL_36_74]|nr:MAG: hypothetical protein A3J26_07495 [Sulfurimonas sp. RIFCSPLOWO2_02_FULL_36_28]OHE02639.1 MAG: hypothetical protein A2W82_06055 [Sulfurimonas sp. RIFCSPLOWO2_12_36_12]OHE06876.1 MAG: hypothetical protein A3K14_03815 [Sulfurimonas sp. RIFCSPLOWO2_12_FULL_36_74]
MRKYFLLFFTLLFSLLFVGCGYTMPTPQERVQNIKNLTQSSKLSMRVYATSLFEIMAYTSDLTSCSDKNVHIYIEGDGLAWISSQRVSDNPTPINPLALKLALQDAHPCVVYISRPCQYVGSAKCEQKYWTSHRYAPEVIGSYNEILNDIKSNYTTGSFSLFGYSGGGAIVALLSTQRNDVRQFVTIAGNLDTRYWSNLHHLKPLFGSLNPADFSDKLSKINQYHLIGGKDKIIDESVFISYKNNFKDSSKINHKIFKEFTHNCCWDEQWKTILENILKIKD